MIHFVWLKILLSALFVSFVSVCSLVFRCVTALIPICCASVCFFFIVCLFSCWRKRMTARARSFSIFRKIYRQHLRASNSRCYESYCVCVRWFMLPRIVKNYGFIRIIGMTCVSGDVGKKLCLCLYVYAILCVRPKWMCARNLHCCFCYYAS